MREPEKALAERFADMLNEWGHAKDRPSVNRMAARLAVVALDALAAPARLDPRQDDSVIPSSTGLVAVADQRARPGRGCFEHGRADCDDCYCDALAPVAAPSLLRSVERLADEGAATPESLLARVLTYVPDPPSRGLLADIEAFLDPYSGWPD